MYIIIKNINELCSNEEFDQALNLYQIHIDKIKNYLSNISKLKNKDVTNIEYLAHSLNLIAFNKQNNKMYKESIKFYLEANNTFITIHSNKNINELILANILSEIYYNLSVCKREQAESLLEKNLSKEEIEKLYFEERQDLRKSIKFYRNLDKKAFEKQHYHRLAICCYNLANNYINDDYLTSSIKYYNKAKTHLEKITKEDKTQEIIELEDNIDASIKSNQEILLHRELEKAFEEFENNIKQNKKEAVDDKTQYKTNVPSNYKNINQEKLDIPNIKNKRSQDYKDNDSARKKALKKRKENHIEEIIFSNSLPVQNNNYLQALSSFKDYIIKAKEENPDFLRKNQIECIESIYENISKNKNKGFVTMATGTGKTKVFLTLLKQTKLPALIVVPTTTLIEQTKAEIKKLLPSFNVGIIDGTRKNKGNNVTITTYDSLVSNYPKATFDDVSLVLLDEVHSCLSSKRAKIVRELLAKNEQIIVIGFTATNKFNTKRHKESYLEVKELLDNEFYSYSITDGIRDKILSSCKIVELQINPKDNDKLIEKIKKKKGIESEDFIDKSVEEALNNELINSIITDFIYNIKDEEFNKSFFNRKGLVFCASIEHAESIKKSINGKLGENYCDVIHSQIPIKEFANKLKKHKAGEIKLLVNIDVLTVGYDDPEIEFIIDFRPTKSLIRLTQTFGRLTRLFKLCPIKTYIQLIISGIEQLQVRELFNGERRIGNCKLDNIPKRNENTDFIFLDFIPYKADFTNNQILTRGNFVLNNLNSQSNNVQPLHTDDNSKHLLNSNQLDNNSSAQNFVSQPVDTNSHFSDDISDDMWNEIDKLCSYNSPDDNNCMDASRNILDHSNENIKDLSEEKFDKLENISNFETQNVSFKPQLNDENISKSFSEKFEKIDFSRGWEKRIENSNNYIGIKR